MTVKTRGLITPPSLKEPDGRGARRTLIYCSEIGALRKYREQSTDCGRQRRDGHHEATLRSCT